MENITLKKTTLDREDIRRALKCLEDNGVDRDECPVVLQALGYILTDTELEDLFADEDYQPRIRKVEEHAARVYQGDVRDTDRDYTVYVKVMDNGDHKTIHTYIETDERDDLLYWAKTNYCTLDSTDYDDERGLVEGILSEVEEDLDEILRLSNEAYWSQDVDNLVYKSALGL